MLIPIALKLSNQEINDLLNKSHSSESDHIHINKALLDAYAGGLGFSMIEMPALEVYMIEFP
ncbi:MAG: hypothetical protein Q8L68_00855 [Methylococcales bacterium]|nr:hypothetical protein [Methylococcales bacterium]